MKNFLISISCVLKDLRGLGPDYMTDFSLSVAFSRLKCQLGVGVRVCLKEVAIVCNTFKPGLPGKTSSPLFQRSWNC